MRKMTSAALIIAMTVMLCAPCAAVVGADPDALVLQRGEVVKLELVEALSSQTNKTGDIVRFKVLSDIKVDEIVVIEAGAEALGKVEDAKPAKGWGKGGKLEISIDTIKARNGKNVPLSAELGDSKSWNAGKTLIGVAAFGLLVGGGLKGKKVHIDKGSQIEVFIAEDITFSRAELLNQKASTPSAENKPANAPNNGDAGKVCFKTCEDKSGDEFKACMNSCNDCKSVCGGLSDDELHMCLVKCMN